MASWKDEIIEATKSKAERETEEQARQRQRLEEALASARGALEHAATALRFARERLQEKQQPVTLAEEPAKLSLTVHGHALLVELALDTAVLKVALGEGKPREFDFMKDRHVGGPDVEEYVGRRALELVRAAQKSNPW